MFSSDLEELGLSVEESKVYLAVLELGGSFASAIAKKAGVARVNCYHTLGNLVKKGLISTLSKNGVKYFTVDSPKILVNQMEEKFLHAKKILPELCRLRTLWLINQKFNITKGNRG